MRKTLQQKIDAAEKYLAEKHHAEWTGEYGEPGYTNPERGIIFANWNDIPKGLADWLESIGFELEWSDEWMIDYNRGKAYRTSPNSYSWESSILYTEDGEYLTPDDGAEEWIDYIADDRPRPVRYCCPSWITADDLQAAGFELWKPELESGFYPGQTDDPTAIAREAFKAGADRVIFRKTANEQFCIRFECWIEKTTAEETEGAQQ